MVPVPEVPQSHIVLAFDIFALVVSTCELSEDVGVPTHILKGKVKK